MNKQFLPPPTEDELKLSGKVDYFTRLLLEMDNLPKQYNLSSDVLSNWIHHNYNSVFILNKELSYNEFKKLSK